MAMHSAARRRKAGLCLAGLAAAILALAGCRDAEYRGKPVPGPVPATPEGPAENADRQQEFVALAFASALARGEGIDQAEYLHPALLTQWTGYGPYQVCEPPTLRKLPPPPPEEVAEYFRAMRWGNPGGFGPIRAWAILDRPCRAGAEWQKATVWLAQDRAGWRVVRYQSGGHWYAGPQ